MTFLLKFNQDLNKELENFSSHSKLTKGLLIMLGYDLTVVKNICVAGM